MPGDLLVQSRKQAERCSPLVRAVARMRLARVQSVSDPGQARITFETALEEIRDLTGRDRQVFFDQAQRPPTRPHPGPRASPLRPDRACRRACRSASFSRNVDESTPAASEQGNPDACIGRRHHSLPDMPLGSYRRGSLAMQVRPHVEHVSHTRPLPWMQLPVGGYPMPELLRSISPRGLVCRGVITVSMSSQATFRSRNS